MGRIIHRYFVAEQLVPLGVCFLGLSLVLVTGRLMQLTQLLLTSSVALWDLIEVMALAMPKLVVYALPMATLIGVLLAFVRLNTDNELISLRAAGVSFLQLAPPVAFVLFLMSAVTLYDSASLVPAAGLAFRAKIENLGRAVVPSLLREGTFIDTFPKLIFFFNRVNPQTLSLEGVLVQDERDPKVQATIVANRAHISYTPAQDQIVFTIEDGMITRVGNTFEDAQAISFRQYELRITLADLLQGGGDGGKKRQDSTLPELIAREREARAAGKKPLARSFALEFHRRIALPFSCLFLGAVAAPLGALFHRANRMTAVAAGIAIFLGYYLLLTAGKALGDNSILPPWAAMWMPNAVMGALALVLWRRIQREAPSSLGRFREWFSGRLAARRRPNAPPPQQGPGGTTP